MTVTRLVVPVGHCWGTRHQDIPDGGHTNEIRVGATVEEPTDVEFTVWSAAHGMPDHDPDEGAWDLSALRNAVTGLGWSSGSAVEEAVTSLRDRRLLVEVTTDPESAREFAANHRLLPLALGLGASSDGDGFAEVGLFGQPMLKLAPGLADLWQWSPTAPDLWEACRESAAVAADAGLDDTAQTDPANVLDGVLGSLHALLSSRVAAVDERLDATPRTTPKESGP